MRNRTIGIDAITMVLLFVSSTVVAEPSLESLERFNSLENSYETPHTKWAKPYAGGTVRTLFIVE